MIFYTLLYMEGFSMESIKNQSMITTADYPIKLSKDFITFLNYIASKGIKLTKTRGYITRKDLQAIYVQLSPHKPAILEKANQDDVPYVHLLYYIAMELRLIRKVTSKSISRLMIDEERVTAFKELKEAEKYVTLLEAFWTKVDWNELTKGYSRRYVSMVDFWLEELIEKDIPYGTWLYTAENHSCSLITYGETFEQLLDYGYFLYYFEYFGLWEVQVTVQENTTIHELQRVKFNPLLKKLRLPLLYTWCPGEDDDLTGLDSFFMEMLIPEYHNEINVKKEAIEQEGRTPSFIEAVKPLFPKDELENTLASYEDKMGITGNCIFKVMLHNNCWRKLRLPLSVSLENLHDFIQYAFDFDDDHLYSFFMDGKKFSKHAYNSRMDFTGPYAHQTSLNQLSLFEGQKFLYLFDFGDEWEFYITIEAIQEGNEEKESIIEMKGESPDQYD